MADHSVDVGADIMAYKDDKGIQYISLCIVQKRGYLSGNLAGGHA